MATVKGTLLSDISRSNNATTPGNAIANVPVVLQNIDTGSTLAVISSNDGSGAGNYQFNNVPPGNYQIVESFGYSPVAGNTPGDFNNATNQPVLQSATMPPISYLPGAPGDATNVTAVDEAIMRFRVDNNDVTVEYIRNGPQKHTPLGSSLDSTVTKVGGNLITGLDGGTFGTFPAGTRVNTGKSTAPYSDINSQFNYTSNSPGDGEYSIRNTRVENTSWWNLSDHTTGTETSGMNMVNGANPGTTVLAQTVTVEPYTNYLFTTWIINLMKAAYYVGKPAANKYENIYYEKPKLSVHVNGGDGTEIYKNNVGKSLDANTDQPEWEEVGDVINSGNNTSITVKFVSEGAAADGNDFAIDDISLVKIDALSGLTPIKATSQGTVNVGDTVTYTITVSNKYDRAVTNAWVQDTLPSGFSFVTGSVKINGTSDPGANPTTEKGHSLGTVDPGKVITLTFDVHVDSMPAGGGIANNTAKTTYDYNLIKENPATAQTSTGNTSTVTVVDKADVVMKKTSNKLTYLPGETITYTINIKNNGPARVLAPNVWDTIPSSITGVKSSVDNGVTWQDWTGNRVLSNLDSGSSADLLIKGTVSDTATGSLGNAASVVSFTHGLDGNNLDVGANTSTQTGGDPKVTAAADVTATKTSDKTEYHPGETITYTIEIKNNGPAESEAPVVTDAVPSGVENPMYTLNGAGTPAAWTGSLTLPNMTSGSTNTIVITGTVAKVTGDLTNTATITLTTPGKDGTAKPVTAATDNNPKITNTADLTVTKQADKTAYLPGETVTYTVSVYNDGPAAAAAPVVSDTVSTSLESIECSVDNAATWNTWNGSTTLGDIAAKSTSTILIRGKVKTDASGSLNNTASVTTSTPHSDGKTDPWTGTTEGNGDPAITSTANLTVEKTADKKDYYPGDQIIYTIKITNNGPAAAAVPTVSDNVPADVQNKEFSTDNGTTWTSWTGSTALADIPSGTTATVQIRGTISASASGSLANSAGIKSATLGPDGKPIDKTTSTSDSGGDPVLQASADLELTKTASSSTANSGDEITYTIHVTNNGPASATAPVVTDNVPAAVTNPQFSTDNGSTWTAWTGTVTLPDITSGASSNVLIKGIINGNASGDLSNTASVTSSTHDPNTANSSATTPNTTVTTVAKLIVTQTPSSASVTPGEMITYTVNVANDGPGTATAPVITDNIPPQIENPEFSTDGGTTWNTWTGSTTLADLPSGQNKDILIRGTIAAGTSGAIKNTVSAESPVKNPAPDGASATSEIASSNSAAIVTTKTASPAVAIPGALLTYTVTVKNNGPATATNVVVNDAVPSSLTGPEFSLDGGTTWNAWTGSTPVPNITAGGTAAVLIKGTVAASPGGTISNTASATSDSPDPTDPSTRTTAITTPTNTASDVSVSVTVDNTNPKPGDTVTYTVDVVNNGPATATGVTVTNTPPAQLNDVEFSTDGGTTWSSWTGNTTLPDMANEGTAKVLIRGKVDDNATGTLENTTTVTGSTEDPNADNNKVITTTPIMDIANIVTTKTVDKTSVIPGEVITYTINIKNNGPAADKAPVVTDTVPGDVINPEFSTDNGSTWTSWTGSTTLPDIAANSTATIIIRGTVSGTMAGGSLENTATVTSSTAGTNSTPSGTATTTVKETADIVVTKTADKIKYLPGETVIYTITITNNGPGKAAAPKVDDTVPSSIQNPEFSIDNGTTWSSWTGSATLADLAANSNATVQIKGTLSNTATGSLTNSATVSTETPGKDGTTTPTTVSTPDSPAVTDTASLTVTKIADKTEIKPGEVITYTIEIENSGPATATATVVTDNISADVQNPQCSHDNGLTWENWSGSETFPDIVSGSKASFLIKGTVSATSTGTIENSATVTTATPAPDGTNTPITSTTPGTTVTPTSDLVSTVTADNPNPKAGDTVTATITVENKGPADASSPKVAFTPPPQVSNVQYSTDNGTTWNPWPGSIELADIPNGGTSQVLIKGDIAKDATGTITDTVTVTSPNYDPTPENNTVTAVTELTPSADLQTTVTSDNPKPKPGDSVTYTVTEKNNGPATAEAPTITYTPPENITDVEYSRDGGTTWQPWPGSVTLPNIPNGSAEQTIIRGKVKPDATGTIDTTITATSPTSDPNAADNTFTDSTQVTPTSDLSLTVTADNSNPKPGDTVTATLMIENKGPVTASTPKIDFSSPPNVQNVEYSTDGGTTWSSWTGSTILADIPSGDTSKLLIRGTLTNDSAGTVTTTASVTNLNYDSDTSNNTVTAVTPIAAQSDLSTKITVDNPNPRPGDTVTSTVTVSNKGPAAATSPTVTFNPPEELTDVQYSTDGGTTWQPWPGTVTLPDLISGSSADVMIQGNLSPTATGTVSTTITTASQTEDPNPADNSATATAPIVPVADISTTVTTDKENPKPGDTVTTTVTVQNKGPASAESPAVSYNPPSDMKDVEYSTDGGTTWKPWPGSTTLPDIPNGGEEKVIIKGKVSDDAKGDMENTFTVTSPSEDPDTADNTVTTTTSVDPSSDLVTTVTADKDNPKPGETVTYTVDTHNNGPSTAAAPTVSYDPPANMKDVEYSKDGGTTWQPWPGSTTLPDIPNGGDEKVIICGKVSEDATGDVTNTFTTTSPNGDPNPDDNTVTSTIPVVPSSDVVTTVTADKDNPKPGDEVTYTVNAHNNGPATAAAPTVSYDPPANMTDVQYSTDGGSTWQPWPGSTTLPDIPNGGDSSIQIKGKVPENATGTIDNTIKTESPTYDPNTGDNTITSSTPVLPAADLVTTVTADKENPKPGDDVTYTVNAHNNGPATATAPTVSYTPPANMTDVQYSTDGGSTWQPWPGSTTLPDIPNGGDSSIQIKGKVPENATGTLDNTFETKSPTYDPNPSDGGASSSVQLVPFSELELSATADNMNPKPGDTLTYTVTVKNNGPAPAIAPVLNFTPSEKLTGIEYSMSPWQPWTGSATFMDLPLSGTAQAFIRGIVAPDAVGDIKSDFSVRSANEDINLQNNDASLTVPVMPTSNISTTVTADNNHPKPGDEVTYTVSVKNNGPATASSPTVSYAPPPKMAEVQYSTDGGSTWQPWPGGITLNDIPNGSTSDILIKGKVNPDATGDLTNTFTTTSPNNDPDTADNTATSATQILPMSNLSTTVTADKDNPIPGDIVTYTVTLTNNGPADAPSPSLTFGEPPLLGNIEYSTDGGATWQPWPGGITLNDIPNGASSQVLIRGEVPVNSTGTISSTLTSSSGNSDPNALDNVSSITTTVTPTSDLYTTIRTDNTNPRPGDTVNYTVNVHNNGPSTAAAPKITYYPPMSLTNVEYSSDDGATWQPWPNSTTLPDIPNGGDAQILMRGKVSEDAAAATIEMSLAATSATNDPSSGNNTATSTLSVMPAASNKCCTVRFYCGGRFMSCKTISCGTPVPKPADPVKSGCTFAGWFAGRCATNPWNFNDPVKCGMALYARWTSTLK